MHDHQFINNSGSSKQHTILIITVIISITVVIIVTSITISENKEIPAFTTTIEITKQLKIKKKYIFEIGLIKRLVQKERKKTTSRIE